MTKIVTSLERYFDLPFKATKSKNDEQVVASDAFMGMRKLEKPDDGEILVEIDKDVFYDTKNFTPICLPLIDDFLKSKEIRKQLILKAINKTT